ncbi:MAG: hypothetical protein BAJALOKI1v1_650011 [Promethearchaeota archaeon]|nr:MAG: hypothetical protein BAJALOKI1v1_650011 [Candidatus Lokiarchaeota archaeon]
MIKGIRRRSTAAESASRFFQTVDLIISHFKREADKEKIFEIVEKKFTLEELLIATASIHLYHNIGIRVDEALDLSKGTIETTKTMELEQKKILYNEVKILLEDAFSSEIDMLNRIIDLENKFINILIELRVNKLQEEKELIANLEDSVEKELLEIVLQFNPTNFYDLIGDLIGLTNEIKGEILEEEAEFKDLSVELEKKLVNEEKQDKYLELSSLNKIIETIKDEFEFKSYKELKMAAMPIRMIKKGIIDYEFNKFPVSIPGLEAFRRANELKKNIIEKIEVSLKEEINYEEFEQQMLNYMKKEIMQELNTNPNDLVYFLQNLNEESFKEIIYLLNKYGINNILNIINISEDIASEVKKNMIRYNIEKFEIIQLNEEKKNPLVLAKKVLNNIKFTSNTLDEEDLDLKKVLTEERENYPKIWEQIEEEIEYSYFELKDFLRKKETVDRVFLDDLNLNNYNQIIFLLEFDKILEDLMKNSFFYILSKILRQLSRIIESYLKISNEKGLYLLALRKIENTTESEEWVKIKIEELVINRIVKRQKELVELFDAQNKAFLINGFILARLMDNSLESAIKILQNEDSPVYKGIKNLKLKHNLISPISYCIAYDLIKRLEKSSDIQKEKVKEAKKVKELEREEIKEEIRKKQEISTLNWIERKITYSLMRVSSAGINPNQLYWQEKDTKTATDNIKVHSELEGNPIELISDFFLFCVNKIKAMTSGVKLPNEEKIRQFVTNITETTIQKRLNRIPTTEEINKMYEGERFEIAQEVAKRIGKFLDKAIYTKFKSKKVGS